jgi:hypothetical protein
VWTGSETIKEELQLYTARHTLCGVVGQPDQDTSKIETKFHVNSEQGMWLMVLNSSLIVLRRLFDYFYYFQCCLSGKHK